ncbi:MAG: Na(+)-translocating NADH-quinone reductase subunit C [Chromatiales bacterium]|nr:Na(+)-translocating NADH-quinone reductase subunit C [Chromatiales bacterium]
MPNESTAKIVLVTLAVCLVSSLLVSTTAVLLEPIQRANQALERKRIILDVAGLSGRGDASAAAVEGAFEQVDTSVVDLESGRFVETVSDAEYAQRVAIPSERDIAGIRSRARYVTVYLVRDDSDLRVLILPVHGLGLWSTLHGFIALAGDLNTVIGLGFHEHGETPGLGGEVDNPRWRAGWRGKRVFVREGVPGIEVVKGIVNAADPRSAWQVDGLAGATLTARGVTNMLHYWLAEDGFGPLLSRLRDRPQ